MTHTAEGIMIPAKVHAALDNPKLAAVMVKNPDNWTMEERHLADATRDYAANIIMLQVKARALGQCQSQ